MRQNNKSLDEFLKGKNLSQITSLNLSGKDLESIPPMVFKCKNLSKLNLSNNSLTSIPKEIQNLRKLKVLNLAHNKLTHIPAPVCRLLKLRTLDISHNLIKNLPKQLASANLINLIISNNKLDNIDMTLPSKIERLIVNNNNIKTFIPSSSLQNLKRLWIYNNPCTSKGVLVADRLSFPSLKKSYPTLGNNERVDVHPTIQQGIIPKNDMNKNKIFISYAHTDEKWLELLKIHLKSLHNIVGGFEYWDDRKLRTGDKWKVEIEKALQTAGAAILIVSPNFLASDFIINNELPPILEKARNEGTQIFPIIARKSLFIKSKFSVYQAVNPPERPLNACSEAEIDDYLFNLMEDIVSKLQLENQ